jgi:hypothetical protein
MIQDQLNEFNFYNKRYIVMKAKLVRQGGMDSTYFSKHKVIQQKPVIQDPSLKKMKEEIQQKENKN